MFAWDASNHDWPRGPMDLAAARIDGVDMFVCKISEGHPTFFVDQYGPNALNRAHDAGIPIVGGYHVLHPGTVEDQAEWFLSLVDQGCPWWRDAPCFVVQIDSEKFSYMDRAPNVDEINGFGDAIVRLSGLPASRVLAYAPRWLYGDTLTGLRYRLWASSYGTNPAEHYREAYPGDDSTRWAPYSGQTPLLLQYGSELTIGSQPGCDASGFRGTLAELLNTLGGEDMDAVQDYRQKILTENWDPTRDEWVQAGGDPAVWDAANTRGTARNGVKQQLNEIETKVDDLAAKFATQATPTIDYDQLATALLRHIAQPPAAG